MIKQIFDNINQNKTDTSEVEKNIDIKRLRDENKLQNK